MHAAPSVTYPVGRSAFAGAALGGLVAAAFAATLAWTLQAGAAGWRQATAFAFLCVAAAVAAAGWLRSPRGRLHWSGDGWGWEEGAQTQPGRVVVALDLQSRLLLRWDAEAAGTRWLWVERASDPSHWEALRRAVYSRASAPIPTFPQSGKAPPPAGQPPGAEQ